MKKMHKKEVHMKVMTDKEKECLARCKYLMGICCDIKKLNELQEEDTLTDSDHEMLEKLTNQLYELCMSLSPESCGLYQEYEKGSDKK